MSAQDLTFEFTTEDGTEKLTLAQYHARPDLLPLFGHQANPPIGRQTVFLGKHVFSFSDDYLAHHPTRREMFNEASRMFHENPLAYFIPQSKSVEDFLNWRSGDPANTFKVFVAGNGAGKSCAGWVDLLLDLIPTDPTWPIFAEHGVKHRKFRGPYTEGGVAIVSYKMASLENTIWPQVIKAWTPLKYIEPYKTGASTIAFARNPKFNLFGTTVFFYGLSQSQSTFESQALNTFWWDEQVYEDAFNGAKSRTMRRGGRHINTMTPHAIKGMPETGAGNFVNRIRKKELNIGLHWKVFQGSIEPIPDWIFRNADKEAVKLEWIDEPRRTGNKSKLAEGMARVYGEFHETSGLVFDEFVPDIHLIPRFEVPDHWTFYRYHDHGRRDPNAAILVAVDENEDYYVIEEFYRTDIELSDAAAGIIEQMTGNTRKMTNPPPNPRFTEIMSYRDIVRTVSDPRSLNKTNDTSQHTLRNEYLSHGLWMMPGATDLPQKLIPLVAELLKPDMTRKHPVTKAMGRPRILIFSDLEKVRFEFENWKLNVKRVLRGDSAVSIEAPQKRNDHLMTCFMLMAADKPYYIPKRKPVDRKGPETQYPLHDDDDTMPEEHRCGITGF